MRVWAAPTPAPTDTIGKAPLSESGPKGGVTDDETLAAFIYTTGCGTQTDVDARAGRLVPWWSPASR